MEPNTVSLFLTLEEIAELTGIKKGRNGKTRNQLQVEQLRLMGVTFFVNACGRPIVTYTAIEGNKQPPQEKPQTWKPAILSVA